MDEARSRLQPPRSVADDDGPLARLSERYVQDGRRHRYLIAANILGMDEAFRAEFLSRLAADARQIGTDELMDKAVAACHGVAIPPPAAARMHAHPLQ